MKYLLVLPALLATLGLAICGWPPVAFYVAPVTGLESGISGLRGGPGGLTQAPAAPPRAVSLIL